MRGSVRTHACYELSVGSDRADGKVVHRQRPGFVRAGEVTIAERIDRETTQQTDAGNAIDPLLVSIGIQSTDDTFGKITVRIPHTSIRMTCQATDLVRIRIFTCQVTFPIHLPVRVNGSQEDVRPETAERIVERIVHAQQERVHEVSVEYAISVSVADDLTKMGLGTERQFPEECATSVAALE